MNKLFLSVLNMSLTASYVIVFVIFIRLLLKKAPKVISYALWGVVAFRLIIPFSFESVFSFMPRDINIISTLDNTIQQSSQINNGVELIDTFSNNSFTTSIVKENTAPLQIIMEVGTFIWFTGVIILFGYSIISSLTLNRKLKCARLIENNIYEMETLKTSFVFGLTRPKIYLPTRIKNEERNLVLLHEQTHIHRKDHIIKMIAFLISSIHWFNPLVWISFTLMSIDMELSCDEYVLKEMNEDIRKPYANLLLSLAAEKHILNTIPLAFGEGNIKRRIKNVLNYRKPRLWAVAISLIVVITLGIGLMANPINIRNTYANNMISTQTYNPYSVVYLNPLYSSSEDKFIDDKKANEYQFKEDVFEIISDIKIKNVSINNPEYKEEKIGEKIIVMGDISLDISNYYNKQGFQVRTSDGSNTGYFIYKMDNEVWVSHWGWYGENKDAWWCEYILKVRNC